MIRNSSAGIKALKNERERQSFTTVSHVHNMMTEVEGK
jgi:hypothetical protein